MPKNREIVFEGITPYPEWYVLVDEYGTVHHLPKWNYMKVLQDKVKRYEYILEDIADIDVEDLKSGGECPYQHTKDIIDNVKNILK